MVGISELCRYPFDSIPRDHQINLYALHHKINVLRSHYGQPFVITSGYRTEWDQKRIYHPNPPKMGSLHLIGAACDIADPEGHLKEWILKQNKLYEGLDLYFEDFSQTSNWTHIQLYAPKSLSRFFLS